MMKIKAEATHVFKIAWSLLTYPFTLILVICGKKKFIASLRPFKEVWNFFWEAKFTATLILINVLTMILTLTLVAINFKDTTMHEFSTHSHWFDQIFIMYPTNILKPFSLKFLSIIGAGFMHKSLGYLIGNMIFLFILGRVVEKEMGSKKTAIIYFSSMIISRFCSALFFLITGQGTLGSMGASGAISGLSSAAMLIAPFSFTFLVIGIPIPIFFVVWLNLINDLMGIGASMAGQTNIGHIAHLGGFFAIIPIVFFMLKEDRKKFFSGFLINIILVAIALLLKLKKRLLALSKFLIFS